MGAIRAASQSISYEIQMGLSIIALLMATNTLSMKEIAEQQHGINWNIFYQPLGFIIFLVCLLLKQIEHLLICLNVRLN